MDHSYESSSKLNAQERPIRTYQRSNKPLTPKEIKLEPNIKLERDIDIVDDYTSTQSYKKDQAECDDISIQQTYPPEMLVINIKDVISSTSFDTDFLNAVKPRNISTKVTVMKSDGPGKVVKVTKPEPIEKSMISEEQVKSNVLPVLCAEPKRPEEVLAKSGSLESNLDCSDAALLKPKSPEIVLLNPKCSETACVSQKSSEALSPKLKSPEIVLVNPKSSETVLVNRECSEAVTLKPESPKTVKLNPTSFETILLKRESFEAVPLKSKSPELVLLNPKSSETIIVSKKSCGTVLVNRKGSETILLKPKSLEVVLPNPESSENVLIKRISSEAVQVKPKVLPKPENSEAAVSKPDCSTAAPLIANVSKVVQSKANTSEVAVSKQNVQLYAEKVRSVVCSTAKPIKTEIVDKWRGRATILVTPRTISPEPALVTSDWNETAPVHHVKTESNDGQVPMSEATLVKLKRQETVLVMTAGNKPPVKPLRKLAPKPALPDRKTERPDEIIPEPDLIKLNLPEYVVDYEPNSNAPAVPSATLLPLTPIPLPSVMDDELPMIVDEVKYLQERITPLLPRRWSLRLEKDGIFAMLFGPGITCAVQRAVYAAYDGSELKFVVHGKVVPKDHSVYKYRLMKPTVPLSVETVREFADVLMGAVHSVIQHHVCIGVDDEDSFKELRNHPGCRLDDNFFGEEGYTKTLRSVGCAYLVWRKNTKRCSECVFFKTLWRNRVRKRPSQAQADWEGREPKSRIR